MDLKTEELMDAAIWLVYNLDKHYTKANQIVKDISDRLNFDGKTEQNFHLAVLAALKSVTSCYEVEAQKSIRKKFLLSKSGRLFNDAMCRAIKEVYQKKPSKGFGN